MIVHLTLILVSFSVIHANISSNYPAVELLLPFDQLQGIVLLLPGLHVVPMWKDATCLKRMRTGSN